MKWYLEVLKKYADFNGRARRSEYWFFALFNGLIALGLILIGSLIAPEVGMGLYFIYIIGVLLPALGVTIRRLHDVDKSGWMILINFIPIIGPIWFLVLTVTEGTRGENQYGLDPKNPEIAIADHLVE